MFKKVINSLIYLFERVFNFILILENDQFATIPKLEKIYKSN